MYFLEQHNEICMSVFTVSTSINCQNTYAEPSESISVVCIELDIQVISSGINNFRVDCTTVWSKKGRQVWISIIKCQVVIRTHRGWGGWLTLQIKVIEYHSQHIRRVELAFCLNAPFAFQVVIIIPGIVKTFNGFVARCWCSYKQRIIPRRTICWEKYQLDSVLTIAQPIGLQYLHHYTISRTQITKLYLPPKNYTNN